MKNRIFIFLSGISAFVMIFLFSEEFASGISAGLSNCASVIIPSLFPFLAASSFAGYGRLPRKIKALAEPLTLRLWGLSADCLPSVILGQLGGYLSGSSSAESLYESGAISRSEALKLSLFCINPGIGFSVNVVGNALLNSGEAGKILLLSVSVSSVITGCLVRLLPDSEEWLTAAKKEAPVFSYALVRSVQYASSSMLSCCGFICLFSGISSVMSVVIGNKTAALITACFLEVTSGCASAAGSASLPVLTAVCAFGGLCVHMQIFFLTRNIGIKIPVFYLFRFIHSVLAFVLCRLILYLRPIEMQTVISVYPNAELWSFSAPAAISLMFLCVLLILDLDNNKKLC